MTSRAAPLVTAARRWRRRGRVLAALRAATLGLIVVGFSAAAWRLAAPVWAVASLTVVAVSLAVAVWLQSRPARLDRSALARHLDRLRPELEESSELVLEDVENLPLLSRLQRERIGRRLSRAEKELRPPRLGRALVGLALAAAAALLLPFGAERLARGSGGEAVAPEAPGSPGSPRTTAPALAAVQVRVVPPAYTGREERTLEALDVRVEEGSRVHWRLEVTGDVTGVALVFDERERLETAPAKDGIYTATLDARETRLYRVELAGGGDAAAGSGYARLEVLPDRPPELNIVRPDRFVELPAQRGQSVDVVVEGADDYGLGPAALVATVASGFGELVEFRERRLKFDAAQPTADGGRRYSARLDLDALGVAPGSEIFFFAEARDRRRPEAQSGRSATHIVRLQGDTSGSVGLASGLPILRVPEFFRSQRQIILDTERLLADEPSITDAEFRRRSEGLGFDQRALRLRYGGLLGEEYESGRPAGVDEEAEEHEEGLRRLDEMEPESGGGREDVREALETLTQGLAHQHDSAEISTYFDSEIKAQLKAALEEMWGAEGRLRSVEPRRALPFEYRALTLLKQVQQRSRLYVQKIGFEAPVLYPEEKRLSGELEDIRTRRSQSAARETEELASIRAALSALTGGDASPESVLEGAREGARRLAERARRQAELDLGGLEGLRLWITALETGSPVTESVTERAAAALWSLLPAPRRAPKRPSVPETDLARDYLRRLAAEEGP